MNTTSNGAQTRPVIHLVRHARSAYVHHGRWLDIAGVDRFEADYNAAGIRDDSLPPPDLVETASGADVIAASDMLRAILSAKRLVPHREPDVSPLLREISIEPPRWLPLRMPINTWDKICHYQWSYRLALGLDHEYVRRAQGAAEWLLDRATKGRSTNVVAITHQGFRRILDAQLIARGLRPVPGPRTLKNWSTWSYTVR